MVVIKSDNFYGLYNHNNRDYNIIMTYNNGKFCVDTPIVNYRWNRDEPIPENVLELYFDSELNRLFNFWKSQGFNFSVVN